VLFGLGESPDQNTNAAGIDHRDLAEVDDQARFAFVHQIEAGLPKAVHGVTQLQVAAEVDHMDITPRMFPYVNIQSKPPSGACCRTVHLEREFGYKHRDPAFSLTPSPAFVTVRAKLKESSGLWQEESPAAPVVVRNDRRKSRNPHGDSETRFRCPFD